MIDATKTSEPNATLINNVLNALNLINRCSPIAALRIELLILDQLELLFAYIQTDKTCLNIIKEASHRAIVSALSFAVKPLYHTH
mgnify:CR=1